MKQKIDLNSDMKKYEGEEVMKEQKGGMTRDRQIKESCGETADTKAPIRTDKKSCLVK